MWKKIETFGKSYKERSEGLFDEFIETFGFDYYSWAPSVAKMEKFLEGKRTYNNAPMNHIFDSNTVPRKDHAIAFKNSKTGHIMYTYQPYDLTVADVKSLEDWCNSRGDIIYVISYKAMSWWLPGRTNLVMLLSNNSWIETFAEGAHSIMEKYDGINTEDREVA
jgi:hypothetical protein